MQNTDVDQYLIDGCMRCKYGATPQCKVNTWRDCIIALREIAQESGLKEELKWGVPVYTLDGKNIIIISALKDAATIGFFKGVLMKDDHKLLDQQGSKQSDRVIYFTEVEKIYALRSVLSEYISEAIEIEKSGQKVVFIKNPEPVPEELLTVFETDAAYKSAFYTLTPGRQRGYIIDFSRPKSTEARLRRIHKYRAQILEGIGINDRYKMNKK